MSESNEKTINLEDQSILELLGDESPEIVPMREELNAALEKLVAGLNNNEEPTNDTPKMGR